MRLPTWISRFSPKPTKPDLLSEDPLTILRHELAKRPEDFSLTQLIPVVVPRAFSETGHWPGPIFRLQAADFDLTWAALGEQDAIVYVSRAMERYWGERGEDWGKVAEYNLRQIAEAEPYNHVFLREDGSTYMVTMLYGQNLAASRLLVPGLLNSVFPEGYTIAVPEMTCAVAFTNSPTSEEVSVIERLISKLYEQGSEPVSTKTYAPETLWARDPIDLGLPA